MRTSWKAVLAALILVGGATTISTCANAQTYGYGNGTYGNGYGDPGYSDPNADPYAQPYGDPNAYPPDPGYGPADNGYADNGYDYGYGYQPEDGVNFSYDRAAIATITVAPTTIGICRSITARSFSATPGMTARFITAIGLAGVSTGSMAAGANDEWRGARPQWWHEGRYGPALGLNFYRSHGFRGRSDNNRGFDNRRFDNRGFDNRRFDNRGFDSRNFGNRTFENRNSGNREL